jgi:hypothetical protein
VIKDVVHMLEFVKCMLDASWTFEHVDCVVEEMEPKGFTPLVMFRDDKGHLFMLFRREKHENG